jgi:hypothetical protein
VRLDANNLVGEVPSCEAVYYPNLSELNVANNKMKGDIPTNMFNSDSIVNRTISLDISHNSFGPIFPSLFFLTNLNVNAAGNIFEVIDENVCENEGWDDPNYYSKQWNDGDLERYGCDGLMCPPGTFNADGRQKSPLGLPCLPCDTASKLVSMIDL